MNDKLKNIIKSCLEGINPTKQEVLDSPEYQEIHRGMYNAKDHFYKNYNKDAEKVFIGKAYKEAEKKIIKQRREKLLKKSSLNEINNTEFKNKVKKIIKTVYSKKEKEPTVNDDILTPDLPIDNYIEKFPMLGKFPNLKNIIVDLMTDQYEMFIGDIWWVAPRPTTFKIILNNEQVFYLIYGDRSWIAQVEGKKYYLNNINEEENAAESISRILKYGANAPEKKEPENKPEDTEDQQEPVPPLDDETAAEDNIPDTL